MDINYILGREQVSLYRAAHAESLAVRLAHRSFALAYGRLLAASAFPHMVFDSEDERMGGPTRNAQE